METSTAIMTAKEIAARFDKLSKEGKWMQIQEEMFADNAVSIEPPHAQGLQTVQGKAAIKKKGESFQQMIEAMHGGYSTDPVVGGNHFSVGMGMDVTLKGAGRTKMDEIAVYEVKNGKIVKEQFFY